MKLGNFLAVFFTIFIVLLSGFQIYESVYLSNDLFEHELENHLTSIIEIKSERIEDYFLERERDAKVLANSRDVKDSFDVSMVFDEALATKNLDEKLIIISKQIDIFLFRNPGISISDLQNSVEFQNLVIRELGERSSIVLLDSTSNVVLSSDTSLLENNFNDLNNGFYKNVVEIKSVTSDGVKLVLAALVFEDDFRVMSDDAMGLKNYLARFKEISNYENLILISPEGFVIYEVEESQDLSSNLKYSLSPLSKVYFDREAHSEEKFRDVSIIGPFYNFNSDNDDLLISFRIRVYDGNRFIGTLILINNMDEINTITNEKINLVNSEEAYLVDDDNYLITPLLRKNFDLLIQNVETENSNQCFNDLDVGVNFDSINYKGDSVFGSYKYISETDWCLISEVGETDIFNSLKEEKISKDLFFIIVVNSILLVLLFFFRERYNEFDIGIKSLVSQIKILFTTGFVLFLVSRAFSLLLYKDRLFFTVSGFSNLLLILSIVGLLLMFYSIKSLGGVKK